MPKLIYDQTKQVNANLYLVSSRWSANLPYLITHMFIGLAVPSEVHMTGQKLEEILKDVQNCKITIDKAVEKVYL